MKGHRGEGVRGHQAAFLPFFLGKGEPQQGAQHSQCPSVPSAARSPPPPLGAATVSREAGAWVRTAAWSQWLCTPSAGVPSRARSSAALTQTQPEPTRPDPTQAGSTQDTFPSAPAPGPGEHRPGVPAGSGEAGSRQQLPYGQRRVPSEAASPWQGCFYSPAPARDLQILQGRGARGRGQQYGCEICPSCVNRGLGGTGSGVLGAPVEKQNTEGKS